MWKYNGGVSLLNTFIQCKTVSQNTQENKLKACNVIKKWFQCRCFPIMNFGKLFKTPILYHIFQRLLLKSLLQWSRREMWLTHFHRSTVAQNIVTGIVKSIDFSFKTTGYKFDWLDFQENCYYLVEIIELFLRSMGATIKLTLCQLIVRAIEHFHR